MRSSLLFPQYLAWHYSRALAGIEEISANIVWFFWHFFSIPLLLATFFSPWERIQETKRHGIDIAGYLSSLLINLLMRLFGALLRAVMIVTGLILILLTIATGVVVFIVWLLLPIAILFCLIEGFLFLCNP